MTQDEIQSALQRVRNEDDLNAKALLLAALVSELFRERNFEPVIVGGSAIEFYTDGAYMSGDTDICWAGPWMPTMEQRADIMRQIPCVQSKGGKSWQVEGLWIDLLGEVNYSSKKEFVRFVTPNGEVVLISAEDSLAGRVYSARKWTGFNEEDDLCARKLIISVLTGGLPFDWEEAFRIAASPKYDCEAELKAMKTEVETELANPSR